mgnify:FL=1|jgi:hypothetical protein
MNISTNNAYAQPANSGVAHRITAELQVPDPDHTKAMEILNEPRNNPGADEDHRDGDQSDSP